MKKKLLIFILFGILLFKVDGVFAGTFRVGYSGCSEFLKDGKIVKSGGDSNSTTLYSPNSVATIGEQNSTYVCCDNDFNGWNVIGRSPSKGFYTYTSNGDQFKISSPNNLNECHYLKVYKNGTTLKQTGDDGDVIILKATTKKDANKNNNACNEARNNKGKKDDTKAEEDEDTSRYENDKRIEICTDYNNEKDIKSACPNKCVYNEDYNFCSNNGLVYLKCGDTEDIPEIVPDLVSFAVNLLKIATPIVLIIVSIIGLVKAITSGKEEDIKKEQMKLFKRAIYAALVFFVVTIVQFIMLRVADSEEKNGVSEKSSLSNCLSCFLNGSDKCDGFYYTDGYGNTYTLNK